MDYFSEENTEGLTGAELAELNRRFRAAVADPGYAAQGGGSGRKSREDYVAERVMADFLAEPPAP